MKVMQRIIGSILCACAILAAQSASGAAKGSLTLKSGLKMEGLIGWMNRDKQYSVVTKDPETKKNVTLQYPAKDVDEIDIEQPAAFSAAVAQVEKGQGAAAIPALQKIVKDYAHLQWDKTAGRYLAQAYLDADKPADALRVCTDIIDGESSAAYKGDLVPAYWGALLRLNRRKPLEKNLEKAMKEDRYSRGAALIMRGDIAMKDGNESPDACRKALTDGYLRVVYLYSEPADVARKVQPEALYKAARCFEKLGNATQAIEMRDELKRSYASSPWANK